jgi:Ca-activated chloride channel homolog
MNPAAWVQRFSEIFAPLHFSLLGYPIRFARPAFLILLPVAVALSVLLFHRVVRRKRSMFKANIAPAREKASASFYALALVAWALALGQPQCGSHTELVKQEGVDLVVALDVSASMLAQDVRPDRLTRAKAELNDLLDRLKGDRVGIVIFAQDAFIQCPLTSDYSAAKLFLGAARVDQMPQGGTNIGAALETSKEVLDGADRGAADKVILLISDGEDLAGEYGKVVSSLKEDNVRVYSVGIGSETGTPIPLLDKDGNLTGYKKDRSGQTVLTKLDPEPLERISQATDGEFFFRPHGVAVTDVISNLDRLHKSEGESKVTVRYEEAFSVFAVPGVLFLLAAVVWPKAWRRRL